MQKWSFIASGGEGSIWCDFQKMYCLKKISLYQNPQWQESDFLKQKQSFWKIIDSPGVPRAFRFYNNHIFLLSEWIEGSEFCKTTLNVNQRLGDLLKAGSILAKLHTRNLFHGDLSPENLIVSGRNLFWIDWSDIPIRTEGNFRGKIAYLPPEKIFGVYTRRSEIFSLAAMVFEVITSKKLFLRKSEVTNYKKIFLTKLQQVPSSYVSCLGKALHPLPEKRYASLEKFLLDLQKLF